MTILSNTDIYFSYRTLTNNPNIIYNGTSGEYDFENANIILQYKDKNFDWLKGYKFERIDNDNDFQTAFFLNEGSKKVNRYAIITRYGTIGYQEGEEIDTFTGIPKSINNFYYKKSINKTYCLNNILLNPKINFLFDSDSEGFFSVNFDIKKKYLNNGLALGNNINYTLNIGNSNATDIASYLKTDFYLEASINNFSSNISYNLGQINFKGPNVKTIENPRGLSFGLGKYNDLETQ